MQHYIKVYEDIFIIIIDAKHGRYDDVNQKLSCSTLRN